LTKGEIKMNNHIKQLTVFVEDKMGELTDITTILSQNGVSLKSINLVDSSDFGLLRIIVDDTKKAAFVLEKEGFSLTITNVIAIKIKNRVGSFNKVVTALSKNDINIEYIYTVDSDTHGIFIFKVSPKDFEKAINILKESSIETLKTI
jgi:hypothetical protein